MDLDVKRISAIVREAGKIMLEAKVSQESAGQKQGEGNFVTVYDVQIQKFLMEKFTELVPDATFFGEENVEGNDGGRVGDGMTFIIDPIDGTTNFLFHRQYSCVSVAVAWAGALVAGFIYTPYTDDMYIAVRGLGCFHNGRRVRMEDLPLEKGVLGFNCARYYNDHLDVFFDLVKNLFGRCLAIRSGGSAALDLAHVVTGGSVAYMETVLQPYDYAAAAVMIEEAGGRIVQMDGSAISIRRPCSILAGTRTAVSQILKVIREE